MQRQSKLNTVTAKKTPANGTRHLAIYVSLLAGEKYVNVKHGQVMYVPRV